MKISLKTKIRLKGTTVKKGERFLFLFCLKEVGPKT